MAQIYAQPDNIAAHTPQGSPLNQGQLLPDHLLNFAAQMAEHVAAALIKSGKVDLGQVPAMTQQIMAQGSKYSVAASQRAIAKAKPAMAAQQQPVPVMASISTPEAMGMVDAQPVAAASAVELLHGNGGIAEPMAPLAHPGAGTVI